MKDVVGIARAALAAAALLLACQAQANEPASLQEARQLYDDGRWAAAWEQFATLADRGEAEAARMAIRMTRFGPQLFQQAWAPAPERMERWRVTAMSRAAVRSVAQD